MRDNKKDRDIKDLNKKLLDDLTQRGIKIDDEEYQKRRAEKEKELQDQINKACDQQSKKDMENAFANMPKDTRNLTLADIKDSWNPNEMYLVNKAIDSAYNFKTTKKGLYMYSKQTGTGKTTLMASLARGIRNHYKASIFFASEDYILDKIKESWKRDSDFSEDKFIKDIARHDVIFIDELGQTTNSWSTKTLKKLLDEIINNGSKLYITSNYGLNDLAIRLISEQKDPDSQLVSQLMDRIRSLTEPLKFGNKSYR